MLFDCYARIECFAKKTLIFEDPGVGLEAAIRSGADYVEVRLDGEQYKSI